MGQRDQASSPVNVEALRLIRESFAGAGMTQQELSRASEIPRSSLANILSPTAAPRVIHVSQLIRIAIAMGVDPRQWVGELERLERQRRGDQVSAGGSRRSGPVPAPRVQQRAARARSARSGSARE